MKQEMESLEIAAAKREWEELEGAYLQKIYQPAEKELSFRVYLPGTGKKMLLFKIGEGLYLTEKKRSNPKHPGGYVMSMRKQLGNARIKGFEQHEFDRVITMKIEGKKRYRLIFEVFGKGNLILADEHQIILPYRSESWSHRELKEGEPYKYPPSRVNPFELSLDRCKKLLEESEEDLVRTLAVEFNLGGKYAEEICSRLGVDKNIDDHEGHFGEIHDVLSTLKRSIYENDLNPRVVREEPNEDIIDAVPFPLEKYSDKDLVETSSYGEALDKAFGMESEEEEAEVSSKLERKLHQQERALSELKTDVKDEKIKGDLIYQNYEGCEKLLDKIDEWEMGEKKGEVQDELEGLEFVDQLNSKDRYVVIGLSGEKDGEKVEKKVRLDFVKSVDENARKYYKKSKKNKKKIEGAKRAIEETKKQIEKGEKEKEKEKKEQTKEFWFDDYKWFISSEGRLVIGGRDAQSNEQVVKKYLEKNGKYAHAEAGGAPSVVIRSDDDSQIGEKTLEEACQYAVLHSKEWKRGIASGRGYWVEPDQVSKTAEAGESLATGAFVVRGKRNFIDDLPLEAALVETEYKGEKKVMCAPSSLLEHTDEEFDKRVSFIPGKRDLNKFAKEMSDHFRVPTEEIQKILPPGDIKILDKK